MSCSPFGDCWRGHDALTTVNRPLNLRLAYPADTASDLSRSAIHVHYQFQGGFLRGVNVSHKVIVGYIVGSKLRGGGQGIFEGVKGGSKYYSPAKYIQGQMYFGARSIHFGGTLYPESGDESGSLSTVNLGSKKGEQTFSRQQSYQSHVLFRNAWRQFCCSLLLLLSA